MNDRKIIGEAYLLILKTSFLVFFFSARLVEKALANRSEKNPRLSYSLDTKKKLLSLFRIAWRYQLKRPLCLPTSLAQQAFLAHYGFPIELRIGIKKTGGKLKAHAWCKDSYLSRGRYF